MKRSPDTRDVRGWGIRDDPRIKEERSDGFYRNRSQGPDRNRRRSRSPPPLDRYEPRGRGRDDYGTTRDRGLDRDERSRRVVSPPANIDRYVPGQEVAPPQPMINPIPDPMKLSYQVGFSYYGEWWRANEKIKEEKERSRTGRRKEPERVRGPREMQEERDKEKVKIQAAYDTYKEELQARMAQTFVKQHKEEQWFRERYVPQIRDAFREQLNQFRKGSYVQWEQDFESGLFDEFSLEGIPKSDSNGAGGIIEKEEGEATAQNEVLGVGDLVPASNHEFRDENLYQPTLLIKTIAPSVSRQNLEVFCKEHLGEEEGGFKWLSLSDPNPSKRYHRIGWIILRPAPEPDVSAEQSEEIGDDEGDLALQSPLPMSTAQKALEAINGKTVKDEQRGDFTCHVGVHNPPTNPRKKALWDLFSSPERIDKDLVLVKRLILKFEADFDSDFHATLKIEDRVEDMRAQGRLQPPLTAAPVKKARKERLEGMDIAIDDDMDVAEPSDDDDEGAIDEDEDEVDDEELLVKKKQLDLMIEYLRRVFNFCFFCVFESDSIHELTRKCPGGHLRRPRSTLSSTAKAVARASAYGEPFPARRRKGTEELEEGETLDADRKFRTTSKTEQQLQRAYNWVKTFEDKITQILEPETVDVRKLGGKLVDDAVDEELVKFVKQEDEHKWRCKVPECTKLFKEDHFWKKHVEKRHTEWLEKLKDEYELINSYVLDPAHIAPSRTDANSNGHFPPGQGQQPTGTPRGFNLQNYAMNNMLNFPGFPMAMFQNSMMGTQPPMGATPGWHPPREESSTGPIRRGGAMGGNRFQNRSGPYDRRPNVRWLTDGGIGGGFMGGGRGGRPMPNRFADAAAGGAVMAPREAVQGRTIKSYEDLDQVSGSGSGELNY